MEISIVNISSSDIIATSLNVGNDVNAQDYDYQTSERNIWEY